jgi:D-alanine-D-alanine ligase
VAVVSTRDSSCRCAESWLGAIDALGLRGFHAHVEEISAHREELAEADLVIEYADTYRRRGELRPLVRHQLASWGARLVGADAAAAQLCDDKIAARERLRRAGLLVAEARVLAGREPVAADGWTFPAVAKRPFEHGSRGVRRVEDASELEAVASRWRSKGDSALLVEEYVEGTELALSVIEFEDGPRALPAVEIDLPEGAMYTAMRKWGRRAACLREAALSPAGKGALREAAIAAFRALGLSDLARFDVRLAARGPVFLEANARPSVEPGLALPFASSLLGLDFPAAARLVLLAAARRHGREAILRALA